MTKIKLFKGEAGILLSQRNFDFCNTVFKQNFHSLMLQRLKWLHVKNRIMYRLCSSLTTVSDSPSQPLIA